MVFIRVGQGNVWKSSFYKVPCVSSVEVLHLQSTRFCQCGGALPTKYPVYSVSKCFTCKIPGVANVEVLHLQSTLCIQCESASFTKCPVRLMARPSGDSGRLHNPVHGMRTQETSPHPPLPPQTNTHTHSTHTHTHTVLPGQDVRSPRQKLPSLE